MRISDWSSDVCSSDLSFEIANAAATGSGISSPPRARMRMPVPAGLNTARTAPLPQPLKGTHRSRSAPAAEPGLELRGQWLRRGLDGGVQRRRVQRGGNGREPGRERVWEDGVI